MKTKTNLDDLKIMTPDGKILDMPKEYVAIPEGFDGIGMIYRVKILNSGYLVIADEFLDKYPTDSQIMYFMLKHKGRYIDVDKIYVNKTKEVYNYVFGKHKGCDKEFCWINHTNKKFKIGDKVAVNTKFGVDYIIVTKIEDTYDFKKHKEVIG